MKTTTFSVLLLVFVFSTATAANEAVLDTDGEPLRTGVEYYVVSSIWGAGGGGLALGRSSDQACPEIIVQRRSGDNGIPVTFSNVDANDDVVRVSTDVNIEHVPLRSRLCLTTTVWKVDDYDASTGKWWVTTDGVKGNPGPNTLSSWFKIEKTAAAFESYKFRYCPSVCDSCKTLCMDIGKYSDDGQVRLALTNEEGWGWVFKKATRTTIKQVVS